MLLRRRSFHQQGSLPFRLRTRSRHSKDETPSRRATWMCQCLERERGVSICKHTQCHQNLNAGNHGEGKNLMQRRHRPAIPDPNPQFFGACCEALSDEHSFRRRAIHAAVLDPLRNRATPCSSIMQKTNKMSVSSIACRGYPLLSISSPLHIPSPTGGEFHHWLVRECA